MAEITGLVLPFFGLILLGYIAARITKQPQEAMGWLNTFIIYVSLPALFFKLLSRTPIEQLARWDYVLTSMVVTYTVFALVFAASDPDPPRTDRRSHDPGPGRRLWQYRLHGAGHRHPGLWGTGRGAGGADILFRKHHAFHHRADDDGAFGRRQPRRGSAGAGCGAQDCLSPVHHGHAVGVAAAWIEVRTTGPGRAVIDYLAQAAAPCALFAMGVTLALRPLKRVPVELGFIVPMKLIAHPVMMYLGLSLIGDFEPVWVYTAVLLASLPTATNVFVIAQQYSTWVERASATVLVTTVCSVAASRSCCG
jgi:malonate transporter